MVNPREKDTGGTTAQNRVASDSEVPSRTGFSISRVISWVAVLSKDKEGAASVDA